MPSKKKSKPSFNVPEELQSAPQAGWVYRSDTPESSAPDAKPRRKSAKAAVEAPAAAGTSGVRAPEAASPPPSPATTRAAASSDAKKAADRDTSAPSSKPASGMADVATRTITSSLKVMGTAVLLTTRIVAMPFSVGMKMFRLR